MTDDNSESISSGVSDAVLSAMFRQIKADYKIDDTRVADLVENFSRKMTHLPVEKRNHWKGNVPSDLKRDTMTWYTFIRGMRALGSLSFVIELDLKHKNAMVTTHRFVKELPKPDEPEGEESEQEGVRKRGVSDLHVFYMQIMNELGISISTFDTLVASCVRRIASKNKTKTNTRGNLKKEVLGKSLSWASFIRGLVLLNIEEFQFKITLNFKKGRSSTHQLRIYLPDYDTNTKETDSHVH